MNDFMEIDLRINGPAELQTQRQTIREGDNIRVGRSPAEGIEIPWDRRISREQADLYFDGAQLHIKCLEEARNPILCGSRAYREVSLSVGQEFRIGETRFTLRESEASTRDSLNEQFAESAPPDVVENSYSAQELSDTPPQSSLPQLEILALLPGMISAAQSDEELIKLLLPRVLEGIPMADGVVIAQFDDAWLAETAGPEVLTRPVMLHVDTRAEFEGPFRPSRRLILKSLRQQQSLVHIWGNGEGGQKFTVSDGLGWAMCVPIQDEACRGWCLFVAGKLTDVLTSDQAIRGDLRFTELLAQFIGATRRVRQTEAQKARLKTNFAPPVVTAMTSHGDEASVLQPTERDMTTLYCEIQGSADAERSRRLPDVLQSVNESVNIVVGGILDYAGAIAEFRADSALGLWGWPLRLDDGPAPACYAALDIARSFSEEIHLEAPLGGKSIAIGISHGPAIAGPIGPPAQARIGAYGPAVQRSMQLSKLTRQFGVTILLDDVTAGWVQLRLKKSAGRLRRLLRLRLGCDDAAWDLFGLIPPASEEPSVTDEMMRQYDSAIDATIDGNWAAARSILSRLPNDDLPTRILLDKLGASTDVPPGDWDGAFSLSGQLDQREVLGTSVNSPGR